MSRLLPVCAGAALLCILVALGAGSSPQGASAAPQPTPEWWPRMVASMTAEALAKQSADATSIAAMLQRTPVPTDTPIPPPAPVPTATLTDTQLAAAVTQAAVPYCGDLAAATGFNGNVPLDVLDLVGDGGFGPCQTGVGSLPPCESVDKDTTYCALVWGDGRIEHDPVAVYTLTETSIEVHKGLIMSCQYSVVHRYAFEGESVLSSDLIGCAPANT